jgi:5-dehydro-4-deoxyglucarate dehydratase
LSTLDGVLFFPVTPFLPGGEVNLDALAQHIDTGLRAGPGAVFVACGTGEFHALEPGEYAGIVRRAAEVIKGAVPLYAGVGGALPIAQQFAAAAHDNGADGLLLLPPYLVSAPPVGVAEYAKQVGAVTELPMIVYNRDNATYDPTTAAQIAQLPNVTGFKDGRGDLDLLGQIVTAVREALVGGGKKFQFFNGTPTAEINVPAYRGLGVQAYSSAVFCFVPEVSLAFYDAVAAGDAALVERLITDFFGPLVALRDTVPGYAVSLIKTGVRLGGLEVGGVRPPLVDPSPADVDRLVEIIAIGRAIVADATSQPVADASSRPVAEGHSA